MQIRGLEYINVNLAKSFKFVVELRYMITKYFGVVDVMAAVAILTIDFGSFGIVKWIIILTLLYKGALSLLFS